MKLALSCLLVFTICLGAMADGPSANDAQPKTLEHALETFAGTWEIASVEPAGSTKEAKRLVFRKDQTYAALDAKGKELWGGTFDLDPTANPKIWDHRSHESKKSGGDVLGIYELEGDTLKVACVVGSWQAKKWQGKDRPSEFKLPAADVVLELTRVKDGSGTPAED